MKKLTAGDDFLWLVQVYKKAMEKQTQRPSHNNTNSNRERGGVGGSLLLRGSSDAIGHTTTSDFVLQWGSRKRLRCMKIQVKDDSTAPVHRTTVRVDRRVVRADKDPSNQPTTTNNHTNGYLNLRQRPPSPQQPPSQRILRLHPTAPLFIPLCCHVFRANSYQ